MLQNVQDTAWNETSHTKSVHVYLLSRQTIPAIQSNTDIHNTQSNHIFTHSINYYIYSHISHSSQSYGQQQPRSLLRAIQNFSLGLTEAGIINTIHNNTTRGRARAATDKCTSTYTDDTHVRAQTHVHASTHKHTHVSASTHTDTHTHTTRKGKDRL